MKKNNYKKNARWISRVVTTISIIVIYYLVFSWLFDTPIEHELKKSTTTLQNHYEKLEKKYDSLQIVLQNLALRDSAVYRIIYEAQPYTDQNDNETHSAILRKQLANSTNKELGDLFFARLNIVADSVGYSRKQIEKIVVNAIENPYAVNHIPSIQPIVNPKLSLFATSFGRRINPFFKTMQQHNGVDYAIAEGTAIFATADGVISEIRTRGSNNGLSISLDHGNGYKTTYSYLSKTYGQVGNKVNRGDVIAFSGNSGLSYAPHLHYEIRKNGQPVNPIGYMFLELNKEELVKLNHIAAHAMQAFD